MEIPSYCNTNSEDWEALHDTAKAFIEALQLPKVHPHCLDENFLDDELPIPDDEMDPSFFYENEMSIFSRIVTFLYVIAPALLAMLELWLRLFACIIAPLVGTYLASDLGYKKNTQGNAKKVDNYDRNQAILMGLGLASSVVLFTDTMYVQSFGRTYGLLCLGVITLLSTQRLSTLQKFQKLIKLMIVSSLVLSMFLYATSGKQGTDHYSNPGIDIATVDEGLYFSQSNALMSKIAEIWPEDSRTYNKDNASPLPTGDAMTGIPFLLNKVPEQKYHRLWVKSEVDNEAVAIDIAFPTNREHSSTKPIYFILHGLNGGSHEEYVRELVIRRTKEGHTCIVMIARGLSDTPVFGFNVFHGARVSDVDASAKAIRKGLAPNQMLAGVGYSMGAIILSNYIARSGSKCQLDSGIAVSGGLDMRENLNFQRSMRLWQPMLAQSLKEDFIMKKFDGRFRLRLTKEEHLSLMRASSVSEIDVHAIVTYNGFDSLMHYYTGKSSESNHFT
jgi:predicted alpha/beta-fold hydrolase